MKLNSSTVIKGSRIILVPYKEQHVLKYHVWMQDPTLQELTESIPLSLKEEYEMQKSWLQDDDKCTFIILCRDTMEETQNEIDSMIGDVNLFLNDPSDDKTAEVEIMIAEKQHQGMGKGKQALLFMLRYGTEILGLGKYVAKIKKNNENSLHLFQKVGFSKVGCNEVFEEVILECEVNEKCKKYLLSETTSYQLDKS